MEPVKLLGRAATGTAHAVRHPISSAAYAFGIVRGLAGAAIHGTAVRRHHHVHDRPRARPHVVPQRSAPPAAAEVVPTPPHESFATKAEPDEE